MDKIAEIKEITKGTKDKEDFASGYNNAQGRDNPDAYCWCCSNCSKIVYTDNYSEPSAFWENTSICRN